MFTFTESGNVVFVAGTDFHHNCIKCPSDKKNTDFLKVDIKLVSEHKPYLLTAMKMGSCCLRFSNPEICYQSLRTFNRKTNKIK